MKKYLFALIMAAFLYPVAVLAQDKQIKGKVVDDSTGQGLPNVSVTMGDHGTKTDEAGNFSLSVPASSTKTVLTVSSLGYVAQSSGTKADMVFRLKKESKTLEDVVVIGYGTQKKKNVTGAVSRFDASKLEERPIQRIDQALVGQMAGVTVKQTTGIPGKGFSVQVRGSGSISGGNEPLYVVDGFPLSSGFGQQASPLNIINPDDIESITVLKDASSTAIYGSRGSNGVVVVTTKHGKSGVPRVSLNTNTGFQEVPEKGRPQMLNAREFAQFRKDIIIDDFASRGQTATDADIPEEYRNPEQYGAGTNWYNTVLKKALQHNTTLGVSGGTENTKYNFGRW